jgi:hypothetical protein
MENTRTTMRGGPPASRVIASPALGRVSPAGPPLNPTRSRADANVVMVNLGDGIATCKEHGGRFIGHLAALDHLERDHPELVERLRRAVVVIPDENETAEDAMRRAQPNRRARRCRR